MRKLQFASGVCVLDAYLAAPAVGKAAVVRHIDTRQPGGDVQWRVVLAIGIACSIYLIADVVYGGTVAVVATAATLVVYASLWIVLPLLRRGTPDD